MLGRWQEEQSEALALGVRWKVFIQSRARAWHGKPLTGTAAVLEWSEDK